MKEVIKYYDFLIDDGNDPVLDAIELRQYMDKWDGQVFIDLLELNLSKSVLEIGVGTGRLAVKVAPKVKSFCGIDISPKTVERAKQHLSQTNAKLVCGDFLTYEFSETFDTVYSSLTFMHLKNKEQAIKNVYKLLKGKGKFILSIDKNQGKVIDYGSQNRSLSR